jgi:hypothetical protein
MSEGTDRTNSPDRTDRTEIEETTVATKHHSSADGPGGAAEPAAMTPAELLETSPFGDDLDAELAARPPRRVRPGPTLYLGAGVLLVAGFLGGVQAQKQWGPQPASSQANALQQALASRFGGAGSGGGGGAGGGGGGGQNGTQQGRSGTGNITLGTVKLVDGKTIYLQTPTGTIVQVKTDASTKVQVAKQGTAKDLEAGSTVIVQGTPAADGTVTATSVDPASGLPTGRGFFGGGAGGGGGGGGTGGGGRGGGAGGG